MIRLVRPPQPESLNRNRDKWTARWTNRPRNGKKINWATDAAMRVLTAPLLEFARGKCAFCEGILSVTSFIEIEHYHAKTVRQDLVFHWPNLFPACSKCNRPKGDMDHQGALLKPDDEDPEPLLWLHPGTGELQAHPTLTPEQANRVNDTIEAYDLKRGPLCAQRIETMNFVNRWLDRLEKGLSDSAECRAEWHDMTRPKKPWKFVIRHVLTLRGQAQLAEIDREIFRQQP